MHRRFWDYLLERFHFLADTSASSGCQCECFQFIRSSMKRTGHIEGKGWHIAWISWIFSLDLKHFGHFTALDSIFFLWQCKCFWPDSRLKYKKIYQKPFFFKQRSHAILGFDRYTYFGVYLITWQYSHDIFYKTTFIALWFEFVRNSFVTLCVKRNTTFSLTILFCGFVGDSFGHCTMFPWVEQLN